MNLPDLAVGCGNISVTAVLLEYTHYLIALCAELQRPQNSEMAQGSCHIAELGYSLMEIVPTS